MTDKAVNHSVFKELVDLFSASQTTFETAEFNVLIASEIQKKTNLQIYFIPELEGKTPDIRVDGLVYIECKDLQSFTVEKIINNLPSKISGAYVQLETQNEKLPLEGLGICLDFPEKDFLHNSDIWKVIITEMENKERLTFIMACYSGFEDSVEELAHPLYISLFYISLLVKSSASQNIKENFACKMFKESYTDLHEGKIRKIKVNGS